MKDMDADTMPYQTTPTRICIITKRGTNSSKPIPIRSDNTLLRIAPVGSYTGAKQVSVGFQPLTSRQYQK
jgi:hypothetical protein